jgi:hypothetical protein
MAARTQDYSHHTRWSPLYHFVATPIAVLNLYVQGRHLYYNQTRYAFWNLVLAIGFFAIVGSARLMALAVQDRVIRLEMRLKLRELGVPEADIKRITVRQFVGLRFASDAELPGLVSRVLSGELAEQKAIKAAIKDWQADWQRA